MTPTYAAGLVWLRRDLRTHDHAALSQALRACAQVHCAFVFDRPLLDPLPRQDRRVEFIRDAVAQVDASLRALGGPRCGLVVLHGDAREEIPRLAQRLGVDAVFVNRDDESAAQARDGAVRRSLAATGIALHDFKDTVVFERDELRTLAGKPYTVFTPYRTAWLRKLAPEDLAPHPVEDCAERLAPLPPPLRTGVPSLEALGFEPTNLATLGLGQGMEGARALLADFAGRIDDYDHARERPAVHGASGLGVHLRFGTLSVREALRFAQPLAEAGSAGAATWRSELVWREFYFQVLANHPHVQAGGSFRPEYDRVAWYEGPAADALFAAWCEGRTGYPLVDAAMRQLRATGTMHNRMRMVAGSFLCKDLGLDWRRGERWFARHLNDYELASNNGGWQWVASSGTDAQPWFRIFNPVAQSAKFDPEGAYILRWVPELAGLRGGALHAPWTAKPVDLAAAGVALGREYPHPVVDHAEARERTLARYGAVKGKASP